MEKIKFQDFLKSLIYLDLSLYYLYVSLIYKTIWKWKNKFL